MSSTLRQALLVCLLGTLMILVCASLVSAQETGTLIVYEEAQGGDATFSFSGSGSLGSFQIETQGNGGAKVFDLPAGTYTLTQTNLPSGWSTQEVFADETGTYSTDNSQSKATFTVSSAADVLYIRYTNQKGSTNPASPVPSPTIPEIGLPLIMVLIVIVFSTIAMFTKKKAAKPIFAVLLSTLMDVAFVCPVQANPEKYIQLGTSGNDEQIQFGTPGKDVFVQLGFGGVDTQYAGGNDGPDWIIQNGGSGNDEMTATGGNGNDHIIQDGGVGDDNFYADWGEGDRSIIQNGGQGNDVLEIHGGTGSSQILVNGGTGEDTIIVTGSGSSGNDNIEIEAGEGEDKIEFNVTFGIDSVTINGGIGNDFLTIQKNQQTFKMLDESGNTLYKVGENGSTITILGVEHGQVIGDDGKVAFQW
jgi:hypothetical protein